MFSVLEPLRAPFRFQFLAFPLLSFSVRLSPPLITIFQALSFVHGFRLPQSHPPFPIRAFFDRYLWLKYLEKKSNAKINGKRFSNNILFFFDSLLVPSSQFPFARSFSHFAPLAPAARSDCNILLEFYQSLKSHNVYLSMEIYGRCDGQGNPSEDTLFSSSVFCYYLTARAFALSECELISLASVFDFSWKIHRRKQANLGAKNVDVYSSPPDSISDIIFRSERPLPNFLRRATISIAIYDYLAEESRAADLDIH